jgi:DNA processing protein
MMRIPRLAATADPPLVLYYRGRRELLNCPAVAIVGSRNATPQASKTRKCSRPRRQRADSRSWAGWPVDRRRRAPRQFARRGSSIAVVGTGPDRFIRRQTATRRPSWRSAAGRVRICARDAAAPGIPAAKPRYQRPRAACSSRQRLRAGRSSPRDRRRAGRGCSLFPTIHSPFSAVRTG